MARVGSRVGSCVGCKAGADGGNLIRPLDSMCKDLCPIPAFRTRIAAARLIDLSTKGATPAKPLTAADWRRSGSTVRFAIARLGKITTRKAIPAIRAASRNVMLRQVEAIVRRVEDVVRARSKAADPLLIPVSLADEAIWARALNDVFAATGGMLEAELTPILTSVAAQGLTRTQTVLGLPVDPRRAADFRQQTARIGQRITAIDEHTRKRVRDSIRTAMEEEGATIRDVADSVRQTMTTATENRIAVIARTESANVWNVGSVTAMRQVDGLATVDVIGCESREQERWGNPSFAQFMYRGEGTCNIKGVPIEDANLLNFHPNHTGAIVPGSFKES